jgi:hypothetical protein
MLTLSGSNEIHPLNLSGKPFSMGNNKNSHDIQFERWKKRMMNRLVIPILQKNWSEIYDNIFILSIFKKELEQYNKNDDIEFYRNILTFVERVYNEHEELDHLEKMVYNDGGEGTRMLYKTTMIRIAAEYEIYHTIFGKPESQEYDQDVLGGIRSYMSIENITYKEIVNKIKNENQ